MPNKQPEFIHHRAVCNFLDLQHPKVLYLSDTVASITLTFPQQNRNKLIQKKDFKTPDLLIFEPNEKYAGLFIELKVKTPFKKNGELLSNEHLEAQQKTINQLNAKGYYSCFSWSFDMTMKIINAYLSNKL